MLGLVYVSDALVALRGAPPGEVTVYEAARLKTGKVEIFWNSPHQEPCVPSLFPHRGQAPCWYLRRFNVRVN
ncbi:MAG: hypothetical protein DMD81_18430 [Candidatus Rokuibacteriota bacterium]|nr:MAG: hypothetical protein DMD81_18430 [Candidatus Rokubacteria bacterium]